MSIISDQEIKEQIAKDLDLSAFEKEEQERIISGLMENISLAINIAVLDELSDEDKLELEVICKSPRENAVLEYLNSKIDNLSFIIQNVIGEKIDQFREARSLLPA